MYMLLVLVITFCLSHWFSYVLFPLKHTILCSHAPLFEIQKFRTATQHELMLSIVSTCIFSCSCSYKI